MLATGASRTAVSRAPSMLRGDPRHRVPRYRLSPGPPVPRASYPATGRTPARPHGLHVLPTAQPEDGLPLTQALRRKRGRKRRRNDRRIRRRRRRKRRSGPDATHHGRGAVAAVGPSVLRGKRRDRCCGRRKGGGPESWPGAESSSPRWAEPHGSLSRGRWRRGCAAIMFRAGCCHSARRSALPAPWRPLATAAPRWAAPAPPPPPVCAWAAEPPALPPSLLGCRSPALSLGPWPGQCGPRPALSPRYPGPGGPFPLRVVGAARGGRAQGLTGCCV